MELATRHVVRQARAVASETGSTSHAAPSPSLDPNCLSFLRLTLSSSHRHHLGHIHSRTHRRIRDLPLHRIYSSHPCLISRLACAYPFSPTSLTPRQRISSSEDLSPLADVTPSFHNPPLHSSLKSTSPSLLCPHADVTRISFRWSLFPLMSYST